MQKFTSHASASSRQPHKAARVVIYQRLLNRYEAEPGKFFSCILTYDKSRVHHYTPETKRSNMNWRIKNEAGPLKAKTLLSAGKILATVFWDFKVIVYVYFLFLRRSVNATYYCELLVKKIGIFIRNVLLLHDDAAQRN